MSFLHKTYTKQHHLFRAWGLHPIAIAMDVYPYALTETHTKQLQTVNTLTLCFDIILWTKLHNSLNIIVHNGTALCEYLTKIYNRYMKNVSHYYYHNLTQALDHKSISLTFGISNCQLYRYNQCLSFYPNACICSLHKSVSIFSDAYLALQWTVDVFLLWSLCEAAVMAGLMRYQ